MVETAAETVESSGDVLTTLTDIKQLLTFLVVVVVLAILFKQGCKFIGQFFS